MADEENNSPPAEAEAEAESIVCVHQRDAVNILHEAARLLTPRTPTPSKTPFHTHLSCTLHAHHRRINFLTNGFFCVPTRPHAYDYSSTQGETTDTGKTETVGATT